MPTIVTAGTEDSGTDRMVLSVRDDGLIAVTGELDLDTAPDLQACIERLHSQQTAPIRIDLSGITMCDSTGISTLIWAHNLLAATTPQPLVNPTTRLARKLAVTGLQHLLDGPPPGPTTRV